jgi:ketosteroid isomerase-like protein
MLDDAEVLKIWAELNAAFNRGDIDAFMAHMADDFTAMASDVFMASAAEFRAAAVNGRDNGWTEQHMTSVSAHNNLLTARYFNVFADGSRTEGAGIALFDDRGKIVSIRALNNSGATPMKLGS